MLARDLDIPSQSVGPIMGSYMIAASLSGFLGTLYLDRFDRRKGLFVTMLGIVAGLLATALAPTYHLVIAAAGADRGVRRPIERLLRWRSSSTIFRSNGVAGHWARSPDSARWRRSSGFPPGRIDRAASSAAWRDPFFAIAAVAVLLGTNTFFNLPPQRAHLLNATSFAIRQRLKLLGKPADPPGLSAGLQRAADRHRAAGLDHQHHVGLPGE